MVKYSCERCGKEFKQKGHYMKHLQRKTPCDNIKDTIESSLEAKLDKLIEIKVKDIFSTLQDNNTNLIVNKKINNNEFEKSNIY